MIGYDEVKKEEDTGIIVKNELVSGEEEQEVEELLETKYLVKDEVGQSQDDNLYVNLQKTVQRCAYCYESSELMIPGPLEQIEMDQWIEALGPQFENNLCYQFSTHPVVCKSHFHVEDFNAAGDKILRTAIPYANPLYERRYFENGQIQKYTNVHCVNCAYCGACLPTTNMSLVPNDSVTRGLYCRKLGNKFRSRIANETVSYICQSHYPNKTFGRDEVSLNLALPSTFKEEFIEYPVNCVYCYNVDHCDNMVPVPMGINRKIWIEELGERFDRSLSVTKSPFICKSHFGEFEFSSDSLPIPLADEYILDLEMKQLMNTEDTSKMVECAYCSRYGFYREMTIVPFDEDILDKWTDVLGNTFSSNVFKTITPWICRMHFYTKDFDKHRMLRKDALPVASNPQQNIERYRKFVILTTCVYCNKRDFAIKMRSVVQCPLKWQKWVDILGTQIKVNNFRFMKPAICRSHFCIGEWKDGSKRYSTVPHRDSNQICSTVEEIKENDKLRCDDMKLERIKKRESMYTFGWNSSYMMKVGNKNAIMEQIFRRNMNTKEKVSLKCVYCWNTPSKMMKLCDSFLKLRDNWDEYSKKFGLQFTSRLRRSDLRESILKSYPHLILCSKHINSKNEPIPDKNFHYSVDELLDHTYANFSHSYLWNGSPSQK